MPRRLFSPALLACALLAAPPAPAEPVVVARVSAADWRPVFGAVESVKRAPARVRIAGTLTALTVAEGDSVAAGQEIARVEDEKIALETAALDAGLRALAARRAQAALDLARAEELRARGAAPEATLDRARTEVDVLAQTIAAREAERAALRARAAEGAVRAPESGRVLQVPVVEGMAVQPGETVAVIATERYVLRARLPERHAAFLSEGDAVRVAGRGALSSEPVREGRIAKVYPELEAGQVVVDIAAAGLGDYFVGERVRLEVATGRRTAIIAPLRCLDRRNGVTFARLAGAGEIVVQPGAPLAGGVEILAGLAPGDRLDCGG
jgi:RND family efflux transporter MFP subunit